MFSQNKEEQVVLRYFNGYVGSLLDLGANDGVTFSNSRQMILNGWSAVLVEASPRMAKELIKMYEHNDKVQIANIAVNVSDGNGILYESGAHVPGGNDYSLVSTVIPKEMNRWRGVDFNPVNVPLLTIGTILKDLGNPTFDFITIDIEGLDLDVLRQIDLAKIGCKCLCIEWNSNHNVANEILHYCSSYQMIEIHRNAENIILAV